MIDVKLLAQTKLVNVDKKIESEPLALASHAALKCYQAKSPEIGKTIDVKGRLFDVGHHTTLQHFYFTFDIEGIAVGDITFGLHLCSPFYNSDQRSGRFCAKMFLDPDFEKIEEYLQNFWPDLKKKKIDQILSYIKKGVGIYQANIFKATEIAKNLIRIERPYSSDSYIEQNGPKIAQEQLRMFISIIFPSGLDFTLNQSALSALYEAAWTPPMKYVTEQMVKLVLKNYPELSSMFREEKRRTNEWATPFQKPFKIGVKFKPRLKLLDLDGGNFIAPQPEIMHPIDKLHFLPETMENSVGRIKTEIEISVATMSQDQRHRTLRRGLPRFTGNFYLPPIPKDCGLAGEAINLMREWLALLDKIPRSLGMIIAPYGAMVRYKKEGSFNALAHEQAKRLCWCAQEEIYHLGRLLRLKIKKEKGKSSLLKIFEPICYQTGKCGEGVRYCGRDIKIRKKENYFSERKV